MISKFIISVTMAASVYQVDALRVGPRNPDYDAADARYEKLKARAEREPATKQNLQLVKTLIENKLQIAMAMNGRYDLVNQDIRECNDLMDKVESEISDPKQLIVEEASPTSVQSVALYIDDVKKRMRWFSDRSYNLPESFHEDFASLQGAVFGSDLQKLILGRLNANLEIEEAKMSKSQNSWMSSLRRGASVVTSSRICTAALALATVAAVTAS